MLLLLLEQYLCWHVLDLDESGDSIIRIRLRPLLMRLMLGLAEGKSHLMLR